MDDSAKKTLSSIPLLKTKAGPRDKDLWPQRLKEEYQALIQVISIHVFYLRVSPLTTSILRIFHVPFSCLQYVQNNKTADNDWFRLESNSDGTRWFGKCWYYHNQMKYEFDVEFDVRITFHVFS